MKVGVDLSYQLKEGVIKDLRRQVDFPLIVNGMKITTYRADFLVTHADQTQEVVEAKGILFPEARIKLKLFEALMCQDGKMRLTIVR